MMKIILLVALIFIATITNAQKQPSSIFNVMTFKNVPKDMEGCSESLFLNKQDKKSEKFICYTDYERMLICINNKMLLLNSNDDISNKSTKVFFNKDYTMVIRYEAIKHISEEDYIIKKAVITIKYHSKIIWTKSVIGGGGC